MRERKSMGREFQVKVAWMGEGVVVRSSRGVCNASIGDGACGLLS